MALSDQVARRRLDALKFDHRGVERDREWALVDTEDGWLECTLELGSVRLRVTKRVVRCVMVNQRRPDLRARRDVLKLIGRLNHACAGVYADVIEPGQVRVGDPVLLDPA